MSRSRSDHDALALLQRLPLAILDATDIDEVLWTIARHVIEALNFRDVVIYIRDGPASLVQTAAWGPKSPDGVSIVERLRLRFDQGIVGAAARTGRTQLVYDTRDDDRYVPDVGGGLSELAVPIIYQGEVLGVLDSEHPEVGFYTADDARLISAIAAMAAAQVSASLSQAELMASIDELEATQHELRRLATTDPLTGIANRRRFDECLDEVMRRGERFAICAMDLDGFKAVNDELGHHFGDEILRTMARVLTEALRPADALVARIGGDEFLAIAPADDDAFGPLCAAAVVDIARVLNKRSGGRQITVSAGIARGFDDGAWRRADGASYEAKRAGGNRLVQAVDNPDGDGVDTDTDADFDSGIGTVLSDPAV